MVKKLPTTLVIATILLSSSILPAAAQPSILSLDNVSVELRLAPLHVEAGDETYPIGYVNLINKNGILIKPTHDVTIELESGDTSIVSVPSQVTINANQLYAMFSVKAGGTEGETGIYATFNDQTVFQNFRIGENDMSVPDDANLILHLPADEMHIESIMPYSIFLQTSDGAIVQAPYDIEINLDFEESLIGVDENKLVIKNGAYYTWGLLTTNEEVGTAFIRASQNDLNLHSAKYIKVSSSLPSGLSLNIFPEIVSNEVDRHIDVIINLVDSEGIPTLAQEDVKLEFFSDVSYVGEKIDDLMKESLSNGIIKKGDFSFQFRQKLSLNQVKSEITIGASTEGLGIALDCFMVRDTYTFENPIAENKTMHIFSLEQIPSNSMTSAIYQIGALIEVESTEEEKEQVKENDCIDIEKYDEDASNTDRTVEYHPILSNEFLVSEGNYQKINLISSDTLLLSTNEVGTIESGYSYGTAQIQSGKETGVVTLSATIKGVGAATTSTEVVNTLKHDNTMIFSPTGIGSILFDKNGNFDLFVIALDGKDRPAFVEGQAKYLLTPINELVEIEKEKTFAHANFHSDSFGIADENQVIMDAIPVGVSADEGLKATTTFKTDPSSIVKVILPYTELDVNSENPYTGLVQLVDLGGNPIRATADVKVKINATNADLIQIPRFVNINEGSSYGIFNIITNGEIGYSVLSANANGVIGSEEEFETKSFLTKLKISTGSVSEPISPGEPIELKLYVDDSFLNSVEGAAIQIEPDPSTTVTPTSVRTEEDGSAKVHFTAPIGVDSISLKIFATAEGYVDEQRTFEFSVDSEETEVAQVLDLGFPEWIIYIAIAAVLVVVGVVFIFLKKPKAISEDEYEDIYEDDEI